MWNQQILKTYFYNIFNQVEFVFIAHYHKQSFNVLYRDKINIKSIKNKGKQKIIIKNENKVKQL